MLSSLTRRLRFSLLVLVLALFAGIPSTVRAGTPQPVVPDGFSALESAPGVTLYRKDYPGGTPDFVQVIDLSQGAVVQPLHGQVASMGAGQGIWGGNDASFKPGSIQGYWRSFAAAAPSAFCVTSGEFFYTPNDPTRLPFALKVDGNALTDGHERQEYLGQWLMLELWPGNADIRALNQANFAASTAPDIISGLTEDALKRADKYVGRTFVGVEDRDQDGQAETVLIYSTKSARQVDAAAVLRSFGADKVMMLDGGGSAQLVCGGKTLVDSGRPIPQAIGVAAASGPALQAAPPASPPLSVQAAGAANAATPPESAPPQAVTESAAPEPQPTAAVSEPTPAASPAAESPGLPDPAPARPSSDAGDNSASPQPAQDPATAAIPASPAAPESQVGPADLGSQADTGPTTADERPGALALLGPRPEAFSGQSSSAPARMLPSSNPVASQAAHPLQVDDVLWVPLAMAPVMLFLFYTVFRLHHTAA